MIDQRLKPGMQFGLLTVIGYSASRDKNYSRNWLCRCACGNIVRSNPSDLLGRRKKSSCVQCANTVRKITHNSSKTRLYAVWNAMICRCKSPKHKEYHRYGGRGISVCDEWKSFETFKQWAYQSGYDDCAKRGTCTLDRINNNGNYEPSNCRWVDMKTQNRNKC